MPVANLAFECEPARKSVIQEQRGLHAVMISPQAPRCIAGGEIALKLKREVCTFRCHCGKFESRDYIAESSLVRKPWKRGDAFETLRLEPAYRDFHKRREAAPRRVFNICVELLEVYVIRYAGARSRSIGIVSWRN